MLVSHRLRLKPSAVKGLLSPDSFVPVGLLGVSSVPSASRQGLQFCNTVAVPNWGREGQQLRVFGWIFPGDARVRAGRMVAETCPGLAPFPFHLDLASGPRIKNYVRTYLVVVKQTNLVVF